MEFSQDEFLEICRDPGFSELLVELDIAEEDQQDLFETLDADQGGTLDLDELTQGIKKLRGDPRKADVVAILLGMRLVTSLVAENKDTLILHSEILRELQRKQLMLPTARSSAMVSEAAKDRQSAVLLL